jgi:HD-like signal output (HDOD) protein
LSVLDRLPPFPAVLNQLMSSLADEDVSFARLAVIIERDTVLTGHVMRLVNSSLYGRRGTVSSVRAAVSMLGIAKLRNYLLGLSVSRLWSKVETPPHWDMARFNTHSLAVAVWTDILVQNVEVDYPEGGFVAGLLHDLGRLMIAIALPAESERIRAMQEETGRSLEDCELEAIEVTHCELSATALMRWGLPAPIHRAVLYHNRALQDPGHPRAGPVPLSYALDVANALANAAGYSVTLHEGKMAPPQNETLAAVGPHLDLLALGQVFQSEWLAVGMQA